MIFAEFRGRKTEAEEPSRTQAPPFLILPNSHSIPALHERAETYARANGYRSWEIRRGAKPSHSKLISTGAII